MANIVHLSEAASIGLHALIIIAKGEGMINVQQIADLTGSSRHHVAKVMQRLTKEKMVVSSRGPNGGFILNKKPSEISLLEIFEAIEGKMDIPVCPADHQICPFEKCLLDNVTQRMTLQFRDYIQHQTIEDYL
ncbi:MAG: Rrf2 family transcriptional regulator [Bacteroidales bacterium]|nr:Rrf2 family transcriptional regulator [Bacteroidales bacterium]